jgi:hypothetical protein
MYVQRRRAQCCCLRLCNCFCILLASLIRPCCCIALLVSLQRLRALAKAADAISACDVVNVSVRRYGNWGLMPFGALLGCVVPAAYMHGPRETFEMYENVSCLSGVG